jgi:hypothetical protein
MISDHYKIDFALPIDEGRFTLQLSADVDVHHSDLYYVVKNIRRRDLPDRALLPEITIKKVGSRWVHVDSEKETQLSEAAGQAIDALA